MPSIHKFHACGYLGNLPKKHPFIQREMYRQSLYDDYDLYKHWGEIHPEYFFRAVENKMTDLRPVGYEVELYCCAQSTFEDAVWGQNGGGVVER